MCGLIGRMTVASSSNHGDTDWLNSVSKLLHHRGPDSQGTYTHDSIFGHFQVTHNRLSIFDKSEMGSQPYHFNNLRLSFNGAIYNYETIRRELIDQGYKFDSDSDTEVLIKAWHRWGHDSLDKLEGMFAFAIYDSDSESLSLVRDHVGIKPIYYSHSGCLKFYFASEPMALAKATGKLDFDEDSVFKFIVQGRYDDSDKTFFKDVYSLTPGSILTVQVRGDSLDVQKKIWWSPETIIPDSALKNDWPLGAINLRKKLEKARSSHFLADEPIAFLLSGGFDSSWLVIGATDTIRGQRGGTFTFDSGRDTSEKRFAAIVANCAKMENTSVESRGDLKLADLERLVRIQGEPVGSLSVFAQLRVLDVIRAKGFRVAIDGQGADEIFAGYDGFAHLRAWSLIEDRKLGSAWKFVRAWASKPGNRKRNLVALMLKEFLPSRTTSITTYLWAREIFLKEKFVRFLDRKKASLLYKRNPVSTHNPLGDPNFKGRRVTQGLIHSIKSSRLPALLRHADRNSMSLGIELRVPYLDRSLVELALSLPERFLVNEEGTSKAIFKNTIATDLPSEIVNRRDKTSFEEAPIRSKDLISWTASEIDRNAEVLSKLSFIKIPPRRNGSLEAALRSSGVDFTWRVLNLLLWFKVLGDGADRN